MKAAGAHQVQIGIESGDPQLLENMNKACDVEANRQALVNCRRHGLTSVVSLIVGFPGETAASLERTYRFLEDDAAGLLFPGHVQHARGRRAVVATGESRRFRLEVMPNLYSMAPYWRHATMSCAEVGDHVRRLDRRLMSQPRRPERRAVLRGMLNYDPAQRDALLEYQRRVAANHPLVRHGLRPGAPLARCSPSPRRGSAFRRAGGGRFGPGPIILHAARSETSSNSWKLSVMSVASLSA